MSAIPGDGALSGALASTSVARRTVDGWRSTSADPLSNGPVLGGTGLTVPKVFSPDFSRELVISSLPVSLDDTNNNGDIYRVDVGLGSGAWMTRLANAAEVFGATPNLDRIVFRAVSPTTGLYATDGTNLELLSVFPDGTPLNPGDAAMAGAAYQRGLNLGEERDTAPWVERGGNHAASDDARRVYFYSNLTDGGYLYLSNYGSTISVSVSSRTGDVGTIHRARFISASHNGSTAYFVSVDQLTDAATPGGGIYRFDLATQTVTQITPDANDPAGLSVTSAISSDDQSHIYFTTTAALAGGAQAGDENAYVWTSDGGVRFIAKVSAGDKFSRVTPDGRYALILSSASIAGAPNNGHQAVYRFDDETSAIACVSCRLDGSPSTGAAQIEAQGFGFPGGQITHGRSLTFDGRVAFTSSDRIVTADQTSALDVYLYDKGTVSLLTKGRGDNNSYIGDISDDGRNIFIYTRSALVGADRDSEEYDIYDIRVGGGFLEPPAPRDSCRGSDCQTSTVPPPSKYVPATSGGGSTGNVLPVKTAKKLGLSRLTSSQRLTLARTGKIALSLQVTGGGTLSVRGRGLVAGKTKTLGSGRQIVLKKATTAVKLTFRLSSAARRELARKHHLSVKLEARLSGLSKVAGATANLTRTRPVRLS
jgi:hypothetical protein